MSDDSMLANLLGEAPRTPDPGFRFDVFALIDMRARRRAALRRALKTMGLFAALGLAFPLARAAGLTLADIEPFLLAAAVLGAAGLFALLNIQGPQAVWARSLALVRASAP
jgi:hypothetical protein